MKRKNKKNSNRPNIFIRTADYFIGVVHQAKKVRWPTRHNLYISTIIVLTFCSLFALYLGASNQIIRYMFEAIGMKG